MSIISRRGEGETGRRGEGEKGRRGEILLKKIKAGCRLWINFYLEPCKF
jgi:hypothetical protein